MADKPQHVGYISGSEESRVSSLQCLYSPSNTQRSKATTSSFWPGTFMFSFLCHLSLIQLMHTLKPRGTWALKTRLYCQAFSGFCRPQNEITSSFTPEVLVGEEDYDCVMICCKGFKILFILYILKSSFYMKRISTSTFFTYFITVMNTQWLVHIQAKYFGLPQSCECRTECQTSYFL